MKKNILVTLLVVLGISAGVLGQSNKKGIEVLYFKANLACCKARACSALQSDVDNVLHKYFAKENISLRVIPLADEANKDLIAKYNAKSQTLVIVKKKGKKETATDVSDILKTYSTTRDKDRFESSLQTKIKESL